jgi:hypothetical protein
MNLKIIKIKEIGFASRGKAGNSRSPYHSPLLTAPSPSSSHCSLTFLMDRSFNKYDALLYLSQLYGARIKGGVTLTTRVLRNGLKKVAIIGGSFSNGPRKTNGVAKGRE